MIEWLSKLEIANTSCVILCIYWSTSQLITQTMFLTFFSITVIHIMCYLNTYSFIEFTLNQYQFETFQYQILHTTLFMLYHSNKNIKLFLFSSYFFMFLIISVNNLWRGWNALSMVTWQWHKKHYGRNFSWSKINYRDKEETCLYIQRTRKTFYI